MPDRAIVPSARRLSGNVTEFNRRCQVNRMDWRRTKCSRCAVRPTVFVLLLIALVLAIGIAVDLGQFMLVRTQLQTAADAAAMAAARTMGGGSGAASVAQAHARQYAAGGKPITLEKSDVQSGAWDAAARHFWPSTGPGNAVKVTTRRNDSTGGNALLFGRAVGRRSFDTTASAVALANPRDIVFVVDLSGSMNDDTEPCWASGAIDATFEPKGYARLGANLMQQVFDDFGFGKYPGTLQHVGEPLGIAPDKFAYVELTKNGGPLTGDSLDAAYRIAPGDTESLRKQKAYRWMIDRQIAAAMPTAKPAPDNKLNYGYWEKYLDYVIGPVSIRRPESSSRPQSLPPAQDQDRIDRFNNPNPATFTSSGATVPQQCRNKIGYQTYVQFIMDWGRDLAPDDATYTPLSALSPLCPLHPEDTAGGTFEFPPRAQPEHAARRALIAAIALVEKRNRGIPDAAQRDWVSIVGYDSLTGGGPVVYQPLTADYAAAMRACTKLQAASDRSEATATEAGLIAAEEHIRPSSAGGAGRQGASKVVILLTDGLPNIFVSSAAAIEAYIAQHRSSNFYGNRDYNRDAALVQVARMRERNWKVSPVGLGLGANYGLLDRMARLAGTADSSGQCPRAKGNPADYEQRLLDVVEHTLSNPQVRIVQ